MPSDPTGVHPQGVLARSAPDFFDDNMASGGSWQTILPPAGFHFWSISLFNDANTGIALKVYGITSGDDDGFGTFAYMLNGTPLGSFVGQCANVRPDLGTPFGQIWVRRDDVAGINDVYPLPTPPTCTILATPGFSSQTIVSPFPLWIVPVGWSLVIANTRSSTGTAYASFWFQQANE